MNNILNKKILYYTKESLKLLSIMILALIMVFAVIIIKFKPVYKVIIGEKEVGYISNASAFKDKIEDEVISQEGEAIAFVSLKEEPQYKFELVKEQDTNEDEVFEYVKEIASITYKLYEINKDDECIAYTKNIEEAEDLVNEIEAKYKSDKNVNISIAEVYTDKIEEVENTETVLAKVDSELRNKKKQDKSTVNGIYLACKPASGTITSRFGGRKGSKIVSSNHKGLDIASRVGTPIYAAADGTVTYSGWCSGYGNFIKISHGNGVETRYGHCSKLNVSVGQKVHAGDKIAAMGSTGNSTGSHLHFEVRINGNAVNPQKYI